MKTVISILLLTTFAITNAGLIPRIIDGKVAKPGEIPYQVSLQTLNSSRHFCGGSILNNYYVLTAAHCVVGKSIRDIKVIAGTVDLLKNGSIHYVDKIITHEEYNATNSWINDVALIKVKNPFFKSALIGFVPLPGPKDDVKRDDPAIVSGFGRLAYLGNTTNLLHWVNITIAGQEYCKRIWSGQHNIYESHLCAYDPYAVRGHCKGDSGGPLMVKGKIAGIVSWSYNCASTLYPSVYTRVSSYLPWIKKHFVN